MHFNCKPLVIRGVIYASRLEAAEALGVTPSAISQRIRSKGSANTVGLGLSGATRGNKNAAKEIAILGVTFPSVGQAAKDLGVSRSQLTKWRSPKASTSQKEKLSAAVIDYKDRQGLTSRRGVE